MRKHSEYSYRIRFKGKQSFLCGFNYEGKPIFNRNGHAFKKVRTIRKHLMRLCTLYTCRFHRPVVEGFDISMLDNFEVVREAANGSEMIIEGRNMNK